LQRSCASRQASRPASTPRSSPSGHVFTRDTGAPPIAVGSGG
jgi:hypothetical protein